ncbi:MAG: DUF4252 domain-containing protein [Cyclobacteriaceae bacterium]|nr:DUF4252 domain-containing protein [Cyclobacteriaceae bacterium]MCK5209207.1 DUF4252 domain-containing protein [Cyclobacteriaceae bacterium]MCK5280070.1 DUF4252 domain-containing protein [Cyclobacteriaceae bacterium]
MKNLIIILITACIGFSANAQNDVVTKLFNDYYDDENFTKISVSSKMFELFTHIEPGDEDEEEILEAVSKLKGLKVIAADSVGNSKELYTKAVKKISGNGYEELMEVKDAEEDMKFMIREKDGIIDELVMVVGGNKSFFILSLYGEIDLKKISKLSKGMNIKGMEHLKQLDDNKN